jgi:hypothetical protein
MSPDENRNAGCLLGKLARDWGGYSQRGLIGGRATFSIIAAESKGTAAGYDVRISGDTASRSSVSLGQQSASLTPKRRKGRGSLP